MFTSIDKALVGIIMGAIFILQANGIGLPDFLTEEWAQTTVGILMPFLVWLVPNKPVSRAGPLDRIARSPATISILALLLASMALSSCSMLGVPKAETFNDRVAYAFGTHTAVLQTITTAVVLRDIGSDEATNYAETADQARAMIDSARLVYNAGDIPGANRQLLIATSILQLLQANLRGDPG